MTIIVKLTERRHAGDITIEVLIMASNRKEIALPGRYGYLIEHLITIAQE